MEELQLQTSKIYPAQFLQMFKMKEGTELLCISLPSYNGRPSWRVVARYPPECKKIEIQDGSFTHTALLPLE